MKRSAIRENLSAARLSRISLRSIRATLALLLPPERGKVGMGVSHRLRCKWREQIPTRFALASKPTSPFQGEVESSPDFVTPIAFAGTTS
ncbi:hypothetical protein XH93_01815 [Bradyrhizobium sp. CCBAU 51753]|nr:hypothetical protein XH93_01815 [Bradyrhizobium sp. CCBAU 51753]